LFGQCRNPKIIKNNSSKYYEDDAGPQHYLLRDFKEEKHGAVDILR